MKKLTKHEKITASVVIALLFIFSVQYAMFTYKNLSLKRLQSDARYKNEQEENKKIQESAKSEELYNKQKSAVETFSSVFDYEQNVLQKIHDEAMSVLSKEGKKIKFCGDGFSDGDKECDTFGVGSSTNVKTINYNEITNGDFDKNTNATYLLNNYQITIEDKGDYDIYNSLPNGDPDPSGWNCSVKITKNEKIYFTYSSKQSRCGSFSTVEYGNNNLLIFQDEKPNGNRYEGDYDIFFLSDESFVNLGKHPTDWAGSMISTNFFWVKNNSFYFWYYDGRYEWSSAGSHNASTYAFIPRIFQFDMNTGKVTEGGSISKEIKDLYIHQLSSIRDLINKAEVGTDDISSERDAYLAYWVGMARLTLTGNTLQKELQSITAVAKKHQIDFKYFDKSGIEGIYKDVPSNSGL